ncbi:MAG: leucine-rich repeat protein [Lachnospiraceae bacterium]|nr:leucine-rich repeat protein [Lachnospiraceae bacterium]
MSEGIQTIGDGDFFECSKLEELVLPDSVTEIGKAAFLITSGERTRNDDVITKVRVNIPKKIERIGTCAYKGVYLPDREIVFPDSLEYIGPAAFADLEDAPSGILKVTIPEKTTTIGYRAFAINSLRIMIWKNTDPTLWGGTDKTVDGSYHFGMFAGCTEPSVVQLYVDAGLLDRLNENPLQNFARFYTEKGKTVEPHSMEEGGADKDLSSPVRFRFRGEPALYGETVILYEEEDLEVEIQLETLSDGTTFTLQDVVWTYSVTKADGADLSQKPEDYLEVTIDSSATPAVMRIRGLQHDGTVQISACVPEHEATELCIQIMTVGYAARCAMDRLDEIAGDAALLRQYTALQLSDGQYAAVKTASDEALADYALTKGKPVETLTDYEKIEAVWDWTSVHICYDWDNLYSTALCDAAEYCATAETPGDVLWNGYATYRGFVELCQAMLRIQGIPCLSAYGRAAFTRTYYCPGAPHAWNVAYDGERWVYFDATLCSETGVEDGELSAKGYMSGLALKIGWGFDFDVEEVCVGKSKVWNTTNFDSTEELTATPALEQTHFTLLAGDETDLPALNGVTQPRYVSADTSILAVDGNGHIRTKKAGSADIRIYDGRSLTTTVTVRVLPKYELKYSQENITLEAGSDYENHVRYHGNRTDGIMRLHSSDESVVTVDVQGIFHAHKEGTAVVSGYLCFDRDKRYPVSCAVVVGGTGVRAGFSDAHYDYRVLQQPEEGRTGKVEIYAVHDVPLESELLTWKTYDLAVLQFPDAVQFDGKEYAVTELGEDLFPNLDRIQAFAPQGIVLPANVERIGRNAFPDLRWVESWPASLAVIEEGAFKHAFRREETPGELVFPEGSALQEIAPNAFNYCRYLQKVDLGNCTQLKRIGEGAFMQGGIRSLTLPDNLEVIDRQAFFWCNEMEEVVLPAGLKTVGESAFAWCNDLREIVCRSEQMEFIGENVFDRCRADIYIPKLENSVYEKALRGYLYNVYYLEDGEKSKAERFESRVKKITAELPEEYKKPILKGTSSFDIFSNLTVRRYFADGYSEITNSFIVIEAEEEYTYDTRGRRTICYAGEDIDEDFENEDVGPITFILRENVLAEGENAFKVIYVGDFDDIAVDITLTGSAVDPNSVWIDCVGKDEDACYRMTSTGYTLQNADLLLSKHWYELVDGEPVERSRIFQEDEFTILNPEIHYGANEIQINYIEDGQTYTYILCLDGYEALTKLRVEWKNTESSPVAGHYLMPAKDLSVYGTFLFDQEKEWEILAGGVGGYRISLGEGTDSYELKRGIVNRYIISYTYYGITKTVEYAVDLTEENPAVCVVTFDANGGSGTMEPVHVASGAAYTLPTCGFTAPEGSVFSGWQIAGSLYAAGDQITVNDSVTVSARWKEASAEEPDLTEHDITVTSGGNGTAGAAPIRAVQGTEVQLWATADEGYRLKEWIVSEPAGLQVVGDKFIMPDADVTVQAVFETDQTDPGEEQKEDPEETDGLKASFVLADESIRLAGENRYEMVYTGAALTPAVLVRNGSRVLTAGVDYTVKYSNNRNVDKNGRPATVTITGKGDLTGSLTLTFYVMPKNLSDADVSVSGMYVAKGQKAAPVVTYHGQKLSVKDIEVIGNKKFTEIREAGDEETLEIKAKDGSNYSGRISGIKVHVLDKKALNARKITVKIAPVAHDFNGREQTLRVSTDGKNGELIVTAQDGTLLTEHVDFRVSYSDNISAGTVKVCVTGIGAYTGVVNKTFQIRPAKQVVVLGELLRESDSAENGKYTFRKAGVTPDLRLTAVFADGMTEGLTEGVDYKLSYAGNKKVGTAKYKVTFLGNYKGAKLDGMAQTFEIIPAQLTDAQVYAADLACASNSAKAAAFLQQPLVEINGELLAKSDFSVTYRDASGRELKKDSVLSFEGTDAAQQITMEIHAKGRNYQDGSKQLQATYRVVYNAAKTDVSKAKVTLETTAGAKISKVEYTGKEITFGPDGTDTRVVPVVKIGKNVLRGSQVYAQFDVAYVNNVNRGKGTIILTAKEESDYAGVCTGGFTIVASNLKNLIKN